MKIVENNKIICDTKDLMKIFKERQLAVKISNGDEYDIFIEMAKEAGFYIPEGLCFEDVKKRPCLHISQFTANRNVLFCDTEEWCRKEGFIRPYKVVSYDEFIHMGCEPEDKKLFSLSCDKPFEFTLTKIEKPLERELEMKSLEDSFDEFEKKTEPVKLKSDDSFVVSTSLTDAVFEKIRKSINQNIIDRVMRDPYDIHISSNGSDTTARFYRNGKLVKETKAELHPDDEFNFHIGAELAFDRLFEKKHKEKKTPKFKPGDKIRVKRDLRTGIVYGNIAINHLMADIRGNVVTVSSIEPYEIATSGIIITIEEDQGQWCWTPEMFELV